MHRNYIDIRSRIAEMPKWFDEHAVPRYCEFHPAQMVNIYAHEGVLMEIACQSCGQTFRVALSEVNAQSLLDIHRPGTSRGRTLADLIHKREIHYGDPPNIDCCGGGPSANSDPKRILEYWIRGRGSPIAWWERDPSFEIDLER